MLHWKVSLARLIPAALVVPSIFGTAASRRGGFGFYW